MNSTNANPATLTINTASANTFTGQLGSGGNGAVFAPNFGLTKNGVGKLTLSPANTNGSGAIINLLYTGATTINNGILEIGGAGCLGNGNYAANIFIASGAALVFSGTNNNSLGGTISGSGAITNSGTGTLALQGMNTCTGPIVVNGGTLGGTGVVNGPVTIAAPGTLSPGIAGIGTLAISNSLMLQSGSTTIMELNKSLATNDQVRGVGTLIYGGSLVVTNLGGALSPGDIFQLFRATNYVGNFTSKYLPALTFGLNWQWRPESGTLSVVSYTNTLSPATLPAGMIWVAYNQAIGASGGPAPYTFAVTSGSLPTGFTLATNGLLSGMPTAPETNIFTVTATDADGGNGSASYMLVVKVPGTAPITGPQPFIFSGNDAQNLKLVWPASPGLRYDVQQSTNLQSWTSVPGYPAAANGPAQQFVFPTTNQSGFFKVSQLDEQPPAIVTQYPPDGGFAVPRFSNLAFQLADATDIYTNSIRLTVGNLGTFTLNSSNLFYANGVLTFINGGSIPLGGWGANIEATLVVADVLGFATTNTTTFTLEVQPQVVPNLFVFGSPNAQRTGQQVGNIPTRALARKYGPIPMAAGDPWTLALVESNRLELTYTNIAPAFSNNTYVCNLTPTTTNEIFYRKIISLSDNSAGKRLTLYTTDVSLAEMLPTGSLSISPNSVIYDLKNNVIIPALAYDGVEALGSIGMDTSATLYDSDGVTLSLQQAKFLYTPSLSLSFVISGSTVTRFASSLSGRLETAVIPQLTIASTLSDTKNYDLYKKSKIMFLGSVGVVPVWLDINFDVTAEVGYTLAASATLTTGIRQNGDLSFGVDYMPDRSPQIQGAPSLTLDPLETIPFSFVIDGSANAYAKIVPQLDVRVNSLVGLYANVDPSVSVDGNANYLDGKLTNADFTVTANADLNVGVSLIGVGNVDPPLATFNLFNYSWTTNYPPPDLTIKKQPQSQNVMSGSSASFSVDAAATAPIAYQWYFNDVPIPGQTTRTLLLPAVTTNFAGNYQVRLSAGKQTTNSIAVQLMVTLANYIAAPPTLPAKDINTNKFSARWQAVANASGYFLDVSTNSNFSTYLTGYQNAIIGNNTNLTVSGLSQKTTYYYRVRASNKNNFISSNSPVVIVTTLISIAAPTIIPWAYGGTPFIMEEVRPDYFRTQWNPVSGANSYQMEVSSSPSFDTFTNIQNTVYMANYTGDGKPCYYRVRGVAGTYFGPYSKTRLVTFPPPSMAGVTYTCTNKMYGVGVENGGSFSPLPLNISLSFAPDGTYNISLLNELSWFYQDNYIWLPYSGYLGYLESYKDAELRHWRDYPGNNYGNSYPAGNFLVTYLDGNSGTYKLVEYHGSWNNTFTGDFKITSRPAQ